MDLALNPDFSQVESDQPQVAINQRFELFYPEKRPFFLENASIFKYFRTAYDRSDDAQHPGDAVFLPAYSGSPIRRPRHRQGGSVVVRGILADDRGFGGGRSARDRRWPRAARVRSQSTVGVFVTSRDAAAGTTALARLTCAEALAQLGVPAKRSRAGRNRLTAGPSGPAYNASLFYSTRHLLYSAFYSDSSPAFRTALGFVPRVDIRQIEQYTEYRWRPRHGPIVAYGPNSYFRFNWNRKGELQEWIVRFPFEVFLKGRTQIFTRRVESNELFEGVNLRGHIQTIDVTTEWIKWLGITEGLEWGVTPNYFPPAGTLRPWAIQ